MLRVGIAGYGKLGQIRKKILDKIKNTEVVAIYDKDAPLLNSEKIKVCKSYQELLEQNLDIVFICTYNNVLADFTIKAFAKGIHVFCEKPPARNTIELKKVIKAEKKFKKILKYGFNHRYHYSVMEAKKIIDSGVMGKLLWMRGIYGKAGSIDYDLNWRNFQKLSGGGILIDQGIHMLDLMIYFSKSNFYKINSLVTTSFWNIQAEDNVFVIMQNTKKVIATLHSSATQWRHKFLLELCFEDGYINLDGILSSTRSYAPEKLIVGRREFEDITYAMGKPKENITWFEHDNSWKHEIEDFIDVVSGKKILQSGTSEDAYNVLKLVEDIYNKSGFLS